MDREIWKNRALKDQLPTSGRRKITLITGARQTGKTSLVRRFYSKLNYINFDLPENRDKIRSLSIEGWKSSMGQAVIDEVQKEPETFEKIKYLYDEESLDFLVLLGSSQILLLKQIRESLAGRISLYELYPLMMSELHNGKAPLIDALLESASIDRVLKNIPSVLFGGEEHAMRSAQNHLLKWGGMPALLHLPESEREKWLKDYEYTYLERDLADLARLNDLMPFRTLQKIAALRSAQVLNYSEIARDAGIAIDRSRRYLEYLKLSYQVFFLPPYFANKTKRLVKSPKLYWTDIGILRQLSGFKGDIDGEVYETLVVSELFKRVQTLQKEVELYFYRTQYGAEIDLIIETPHGVIGAEIKSRSTWAKKDIRYLKDFAQKIEKPWCGGLLIYTGDEIKKISSEANIWAVPSHRLFA